MATKVSPLPDRFGVRRAGEPDRLIPPPVVPQEAPAPAPAPVQVPTPASKRQSDITLGQGKG